MKRTIISAVVALMCIAATAQERKQLPTPQPAKLTKMTLMDALKMRQSIREFVSSQLSDEQLSIILWAACGINRPESGKLTNPTAMNMQDIKVYVCRADGAWLYDAKGNALVKVLDKDLRAIIAGGQTSVKEAPVTLLLVSDQKNARRPSRDFAYCDAGYVSQNIYLACTALGMGTVARAMMDKDALQKEFGFDENQFIVLNHPIGFAK